MKKLSILLITALLLFSCKKEDPPPQLTGTWDLYQTFTSGGSFNWTVVITQNGKNLTGNTVISDNSGYALLMSSSNISGNNVTIEWMLSTFSLSCQGTVNANYDSMNGLFYSNPGNLKMGTWLANKRK